MRKLVERAASYVRRVWTKLFVDRWRYGTGNGYRAAEYWRDRLGSGGNSLAGPGHEGWTQERNQAAYDAARRVLESELDVQGAGTAANVVLEVGPGTGVWTAMCADRGVEKLTGIDITDVQFSVLRDRFPSYTFIRGDASEGVPNGPFDLVLLLDVIEHVVTETGLHAMLRNLETVTARGGILVISFPPPALGRRNLFYLRFWPAEQVLAAFRSTTLLRQVPFRDGTLLILKRQDSQPEKGVA